MGSVPIYYYQQPLLSPPGCHTTDDSRPSVRRGSIARSASARRLGSCEDKKLAAGGRRRDERGSGSGGGNGERAADNDNAWLKRCQTAPGYVSFEDVIGGDEALFGREGRRPPDAPGIISDPLMRTASQLYASEGATHHQPRHRRRSPGPLGTRRGGAMYRLVKKYVNPCLGFLASALSSAAPLMPRPPALSPRDRQVNTTRSD